MAKKPPVDPLVYKTIFEDNRFGAEILDELVRRYGSNPYVRGDLAAQRQTDFNAGQLSVVSFILDRINKANGVDINESFEIPSD